MSSVGTAETHAHEYSWHLYVVAGYREDFGMFRLKDTEITVPGGSVR